MTIQTKCVFKTSFDGRSVLFQTSLILYGLTSLLLKPTLILAKSLTSDPYSMGPLFWRKSVSLNEWMVVVAPWVGVNASRL